MNAHDTWVAFTTILHKEVTRFLRIWSQTLLPPVINQSLYFIIFGAFIGSQIRSVNGIPYMSFIIPGLVMMAVINSSFTNVVSSFFGSKFQRNIEELLVSPTPNWVIISGYVMGGVLRGILVGAIVFLVSVFFTHPVVHDPFMVVLFVFLTAVVFALGGFINALFATKFDDVSIFPTFVLTPLTYFGGVFYSIKDLPPLWQTLTRFNPILYMIDGFRYGFFGVADVDVRISVVMLLAFTVLLYGLSHYLLKKGTGLRN
ncbi:MAG: ABC transporter permease [Candidatus Gracilibacteria bacterium]